MQINYHQRASAGLPSEITPQLYVPFVEQYLFGSSVLAGLLRKQSSLPQRSK